MRILDCIFAAIFCPVFFWLVFTILQEALNAATPGAW